MLNSEQFENTFYKPLGTVPQSIEANMFVIVFLWIIGAFVFSFRLIGGWWYINNLKRDAIYLQNEWSNFIEKCTRQLEIKKTISLAETHLITSPMVIGYFKPVVLVPLGMLTSLTADQLETIFLHELAHIKRHDYLINLIQSFIEVVLFFNPFVWIISKTIRKEREFCCDDAVINTYGNPMVYARALAQIEESRIVGNSLALSLADNKNELWNRIKRIMEKSHKTHNSKNRFIPAILLIVGLLCASWLTVRTDKQHGRHTPSENISRDTTIKKNSKSSIHKQQINSIGGDRRRKRSIY